MAPTKVDGSTWLGIERSGNAVSAVRVPLFVSKVKVADSAYNDPAALPLFERFVNWVPAS